MSLKKKLSLLSLLFILVLGSSITAFADGDVIDLGEFDANSNKTYTEPGDNEYLIAIPMVSKQYGTTDLIVLYIGYSGGKWWMQPVGYDIEKSVVKGNSNQKVAVDPWGRKEVALDEILDILEVFQSTETFYAMYKPLFGITILSGMKWNDSDWTDRTNYPGIIFATYSDYNTTNTELESKYLQFSISNSNSYNCAIISGWENFRYPSEIRDEDALLESLDTLYSKVEGNMSNDSLEDEQLAQLELYLQLHWDGFTNECLSSSLSASTSFSGSVSGNNLTIYVTDESDKTTMPNTAVIEYYYDRSNGGSGSGQQNYGFRLVDGSNSTDLNTLLNSLSSTNLDNFPMLKTLRDLYNDFYSDMSDRVGEANQQSAAAAVASSAASGTTYYLWARSINNYVSQKGTETELDGYDLTNFSTDDLTDEEVLSLQAWYTILINASSLSDCSNGALIFPDSGNTVTFDTSSGMNAETIERYLSSLDTTTAYTTGSYENDENRLMDSYQIAQWCVGLMYGIDMSQYSSLNTIEGYILEVGKVTGNDIKFNNFAFSYDSSKDETQFTYKNLSNVGYVMQSSDPDVEYRGLYNIYYLLTLMQSWADANNNTVVSIIERASKNVYITDSELEGLSTQIKIMHATCETLEFLGVEPFSEQLAYIWKNRNSIDTLYDRLMELDPDDTYEAEDELLGDFFSKSTTQFSTDYQEGVALSATYIPFETNLYETTSVTYVSDTEWVSRFHYPYGFYRKVLYIDTDTNAAVNRYVTGTTSSGKEIATLRDLMETEKDIVLYLDTNFYNADEISSYMDKVWNKTTNSADADTDDSTGIIASITHTIKDQMNVSMEAILKTAGYTTYSSNIESKVKTNDTDSATDYIFSEEDIKALLTVYSEDGEDEVYNDYTVLQSFAVVSAIYRDKVLFSNLSSAVKANDPVFVSSPNLAGTEGIGEEEFNSIYNYAMLKNLEAALPLDADVTLDLDAPLFMDIYGNIITEDGYVVIPAASNATLCGDDSYDPHTAGFIYYYNQGAYAIPEDYNNADDYITGYFNVDSTTDTYKLSWFQYTEDGVTRRYDFSNFPLSNESALSFLKSLAKTNFNEYSVYNDNFYKRVYLITEVLRGAPLEYIDYEFEGITSYTDVSKIGVYFANKLDELADALLSKTNGNSLIELPNLAFMEGVEYVILFLFKIIFAACLALLFYRMYIDAVQGVLGIKTMTSFVISMVMFLVVSFAIPEALDLSYYQVNKRLLQSETEYIAMLNLEKSSEGREIGVTSVSAPETETELYLKVDDLSIPWYTILDDILFKSTFTTVSEIYDEALEDSALANLPGFVKKGDGLYISVDYLFDTSVIEYESSSGELLSIVTETPYASYVTPYYAILDLLVARVNYYNSENEYETYTTTVQSGGRVRTKGAITAYFLSEDFLANSSDVLGLRAMYGMDVLWAYDVDPFDDEDLEKMSYSYWYRDNYDEDELEEIFQELDTKARKFVADNRSLLGKVSDETFLKVMALSMAVDYNKAMKISSANAIEIYDIDTRDLLRLSVADKSTVMSQCSKSFARFIFDEAGTLGTVVVAFLLVIYFIASWGKAIMIFIILGSMIAAAVFRRTIKRDERGSIEGVIVTLAILCGTNVLYALLLKCTMLIPQLGVTTVVACFIQIILQIVYLAIMAALTWIVLSDWKNVGYSTYTMFAHKAYYRIRDGRTDSHRTILRSRNTVVEKEGKQQSRKGSSVNTGEMTANDMLRRMIDEDYERKEYKRK